MKPYKTRGFQKSIPTNCRTWVSGTGGGKAIGGFADEDAYPGTIEGFAGGATGTRVSKPTDGNFYSILPLLMAEADRRARRKDDEKKGTATSDGYHQTLDNLFTRIHRPGRQSARNTAETSIFRSRDGSITRDPIVVSSDQIDAALAGFGVAIPAAPAGSRRSILLTSDEAAPLAGIFLFSEESGEVVSSIPIQGSASTTVGEFLAATNPNGCGSGTSIDTATQWSARPRPVAPSPTPAQAQGSFDLSEAFGIL